MIETNETGRFPHGAEKTNPPARPTETAGEAVTQNMANRRKENFSQCMTVTDMRP